MTEERFKWYQAEIARLKELDKQTSERVNNEFEANESIVIECSLELDYEFQQQSE